MKGKVVLVTGANGGLGIYLTQAFLDAGATVIGSSRTIQQSDFEGPAFTAVAAEISNRENARVLVDQAVSASEGWTYWLIPSVDLPVGNRSLIWMMRRSKACLMSI